MISLSCRLGVEGHSRRRVYAYAIDEGKDVIPVVIQECRIPFRLRPFQYADFSVSYDSGLEELLSGLSGEHQATAHTTVLPEDKARARDDDDESVSAEEFEADMKKFFERSQHYQRQGREGAIDDDDETGVDDKSDVSPEERAAADFHQLRRDRLWKAAKAGFREETGADCDTKDNKQ